MSRGFDPKARGGYSGGSVEERRKQAIAAQQERLKKCQDAVKNKINDAPKTGLKENEVKAQRWEELDFLKAIDEIPFTIIGQNERLHISQPYRALTGISLKNVNQNTRETVLCWPNCDPSPAALAAITALADCAVSKPVEYNGKKALTQPKGFRALIYPYARTAHRALRHIYVDKDYLGQLQLLHQVRSVELNEDEAYNDYHKTLARVKRLSGRALDGKEYSEFRNPCLDETMPSGPCIGDAGRSELLWRVGTKTDLSEISRTRKPNKLGASDDPVSAKFYLFGLRDNESIKNSLRKMPAPLDVIYLDLDKTGRDRLGKNWFNKVQDFLKEVEARFPAIPIVALTDDPWTYDKLRFECFAHPQQKKGKRRPGASSVVFAPHPDIVLSKDYPAPEYSAVKDFDIITYSGDVAALLQQLRSARNEANDQGDAENATRLQKIIGVISRCASLPGSQSQLGNFIEKEIGANAAADMMAVYRVGGHIADLKNSFGGWAQNSRQKVITLCNLIERVWENTEQLTPMAPLLRDLVKRKFLKSSSRAVIVFPKDMLAEFATEILCNDEEIGEEVKSRIDKDMLQFFDQAGLKDISDLPIKQRNSIKTAVFVAPARSTIMNLLARPWLPETVLTLIDSDTIQSAARDVQRISTYPELASLKPRMETFVSVLSKQ